MKHLFPLLLLTLGTAPAALQAQCTTSLTYMPANPISGQPLTFTFSVNYAPGYVPAVGANREELWSWSSLSGASYQTGGPGALLQVPFSVNFTVSPASAGAFVVDAAYLQQYASGETPACFSPSGGTGSGDTEVTILVAPSGKIPGNPAALAGQYAFQFNGTQPNAGPAGKVAAIGSFTADGHGHITSGEEDINTPQGMRQAMPISSGTYTVDGSIGTVTLITPVGAQHFDLFASNYLTSGASPTITDAGLIYTDAAPLGSGTITRQVAYVPAGTYVVNWQGAPPQSANVNSIFTPAYAGGLVNFANGQVSAYLDVSSAASGVLQGVSEQGLYQQADSRGRFTYTLGSGGASQQPMHFVGYTLDATHFNAISVDSYQTSFLFSGTAMQ